MGNVIKGLANFTGIGGLSLTWPEKLLMFFAPFYLPLLGNYIENFNLDLLARILLLNIIAIVLLKIRCRDKISLTNLKTYLARGPTYLLIIWYIILMVLSVVYMRIPYGIAIYNLMKSFIGSLILGFLLMSSYRTDAGANCG